MLFQHIPFSNTYLAVLAEAFYYPTRYALGLAVWFTQSGYYRQSACGGIVLERNLLYHVFLHCQHDTLVRGSHLPWHTLRC